MRDDRATAMNDRSVAELGQSAQCGGGDQLVAPARGNDIDEARFDARVRELNRGRGQRGENRIRTENDDRYGLRHSLLGARWK